MQLALTVVTSLTSIALAWIAYRQEMVRRDLRRFNGHVDDSLQAIHAKIDASVVDLPQSKA